MTEVAAVFGAAMVGAFIGCVAGIHIGLQMTLPAIKEALSDLVEGGK